MSRDRKSPVRVVCKPLAFPGMKSCQWKPVGEFHAIEFTNRKVPSERAIVHRSTKKVGNWQVSLFDERGPVSDSQHSSLTDALKLVFPKRWKLTSFG